MFIDIACNITCEKMQENIEQILQDCRLNKVFPVFVGLDVSSSEKCLELARIYNTCCFLGVHPNHIQRKHKQSIEDDFTGKSEVEVLKNSIKNMDFSDARVIGIGECGLDYFRSCKSKEQLEIFAFQVGLQEEYDLPIFYHCRDAFEDFIRIAISNGKAHRGVVHSFDGTVEEARTAISYGFCIGINGCSLRTEENIEVVKDIPLTHILLETDSPYCQIRKGHASSQFATIGRSKFSMPVNIRNVAEAVACIKGISIEELERITYENTVRLFPKLKKFVDQWK
ncbi:TatD family hydrolase [Vittaforma corneae ATCC 50505]|uniref:TatD family hydrolase n=1 Tax=Vittaforma corneae (strain ATCC 50505) TaxID=993615 RepID=L2GMF8_VITCO|nr:TatD family hydrolase [Vittaforma corneae ATCC 50505]ELA41824.1 TatD family hydrolase [Vittaforma corneae ATCC 50505]